MHPEAGLTDYYPAEVAVRRTVIDHTASTYVLADSSKLGEIAVHRVCTLDRLTAVLTDDAENSAAFAALAAAGLTLLRAQVTEQPADEQNRLDARTTWESLARAVQKHKAQAVRRDSLLGPSGFVGVG